MGDEGKIIPGAKDYVRALDGKVIEVWDWTGVCGNGDGLCVPVSKAKGVIASECACEDESTEE